MRAILADRYGSPEVFRLAEIPIPTPKAGEILVRVQTAAATPPDCAYRTGKPRLIRLFSGLRRPRVPILGDIMAGEVVEVGAGVTVFAPGDLVFGSPAPPTGAYAEYRCVPASAMGLMPQGVGFAEAAALVDGGMTALPFTRDHGKVRPGMHVLVNGAAGAIGSSAVQLAKHFGAEVTGVCGPVNIETVRRLGADEVIDYSVDDFTARRAAYDVIFDVVGKSSFRKCRAALRPGGVYMTTVPGPATIVALLKKSRSVGRRSIFAATGLRSAAAKARDLAFIRDLAEAGVLRGIVGRSFPLEAMAEAHRYVETGHKRGSAIIAIGDGALSRSKSDAPDVDYHSAQAPSGFFQTPPSGAAVKSPSRSRFMAGSA
ncbi:MAG: NAD(P)-dependent alcohol dehydrogenase [Bauldia sp.]